MAIDIGAEAEDRGFVVGETLTLIDKDNPANASGTITSVEIWANSNLSDCVVGTFYTTNGDTLKCRDSATIGSVTAGSKQTFTEDSGSTPLAIAVEAGDYIGAYYTAGELEADTSLFVGVWYVSGEYIDPNDETTYTFVAGYAISLKGIGTEEEPPVGQPYISRVQGVQGMRSWGGI